MTRIPSSEYARRRQALMEQMEPDSIAILPAAPVLHRATATSSTSTARTATSST